MSILSHLRAARRSFGVLALGAVPASCGIAPGEPAPPPVRRAVLVSVDGLRADALEHMPALSALRSRAQWSDSALTVVPSLTVPGHLSLFSGRDVSTLGIVTNTLDETAAMTLMVNGATSIFQWVRAAGGSSAAIIGGSLVPASQLAMAKSFFGLDVLIAAPEATSAIIDQAIIVATDAEAPQITFVHVSAVDAAGHSAGWVDGDGRLTPAYIAVVADVDREVARLVSALESAMAAGELAVMITADHGGGRGHGCTDGIPPTREHCTAHDGDRRIPYLLLAAGVAPGRLVGRPTITQLAPTLANLLRVPRPRQVDGALWF